MHASGGLRERYEPVERVAGMRIPTGDSAALARAYLAGLGLKELYVADLDAIAGQPPQTAAMTGLTALGAPAWIDAGVRTRDQARHLIDGLAAQVVVGLETLPSFDVLADVCESVGGHRVAFSLDLREGRPVASAALGDAGVRHESGRALASRAAAAGAGSVIVIDLARVGGRAGLDIGAIGRIRDAVPELTLLAGGGVRDADDLARLADAGCDGALVATALHDGRLGAQEIAAAARLGPRFARPPSETRRRS